MRGSPETHVFFFQGSDNIFLVPVHANRRRDENRPHERMAATDRVSNSPCAVAVPAVRLYYWIWRDATLIGVLHAFF